MEGSKDIRASETGRGSGTTPLWREEDRLAALRSYNVLDSEREAAFDDFVELAQMICGTKVALINMIDADRQWFKAEIGFPEAPPSLAVSLCAHAICEPGTMVVPDASCDGRFADNDFVHGPPFLRFYAGVPLLSEGGLPIGTICVIDPAARPQGLEPAQRRALEALGRQVMVQLEMRRALEERALAEAALTIAHNRTQDILSSIDDPFYVVDRNWQVSFVNAHILAALGMQASEVIGASLFDLFPGIANLEETDGIRLLREAMRTRQTMRREIYSNAFPAWCDMAVYPMSDGGLSVYIKDISARKRLEVDLGGALAQVRDALAEKDLLMLETHHRVKNSLQMVQSLLTLQARNIDDPEIAQQVQESAARVRTFGALHETLYHIAEGTEVDIGSYLEKLVRDLNAGMGATLVGRPVRLEVESTRWPASDVSTLGLVLTELVTNALKYGAGTVTVRFGADDATPGASRLTVEDEGQGLPADFDPATTRGLGMRLVLRLLRERDARLVVDRSVAHTRMVVSLTPPALGRPVASA